MPNHLSYKIIPVTPYAQNASLLWCTETATAAFVDPGGEIDKLLQAAEQEEVQPDKILLTHGHIDHVGFAGELAERTGLPILGPHEDDRFLLESLDEYGTMLGLSHSGNFTPDQWLREGDVVNIGSQSLSVIHTPGHTPGHIVFYYPQGRLALVGDVLFHHSIGRSDFPRGNHAQLIDSIKHKLLPLGDDVQFIPGHGPMSSFGEERRHNPFLQS